MCKIRNLVFVGALIYQFDYVDHTNFPWFRISSQILRFISGESKKEQKRLLFVVRTHTHTHVRCFHFLSFSLLLVLFALLSFHSTLEPSRLLLLLLLCVFFGMALFYSAFSKVINHFSRLVLFVCVLKRIILFIWNTIALDEMHFHNNNNKKWGRAHLERIKKWNGNITLIFRMQLLL